MHNVLIVDDEVLIREGITDGIDWYKLECNPPFNAENGLEAIDILNTNDIDIVITDIKMPGMNGLELAEWVKENRKSIGVVILSGYDDFKFAQSALSFGVEEYILKPTKFEELEKSINKIKKKLDEKCKENEAYNRSREIIEKSSGLAVLESHLFNRIQNVHTPLFMDGNLKTTSYMHRIAVIQVCNHTLDQLGYKGYISDFVNGLEASLKCCGLKKGICHIVKCENDELILYFYTTDNSLSSTDLQEAMDSFVTELGNRYSGLVPFTIYIGLSEVGYTIDCLKDLYHCALINSDMEKKRLSHKREDLEYDRDISRLSGRDLKNDIEKRNLRALSEDVDIFFSRLADKPLNDIKSYSIELVANTVSLLNSNIFHLNIDLHKVYETIIKSIDKNEVTTNVLGILKKLCLDFKAGAGGSLPNAEFAETIIEYLKGNFSRDLTLEQVAANFYISPGHMSRLIKKSCEMTFLDVLTRIRIENARILLKNPKYKAYEVGGMVGFKDAKYFSQVFKKHTGKKPSEYK